MSKAASLAQLRALRAAGKTRLDSYQVQEQDKIYEEVDEEGYKKVVRGRLDRDDFVIDDNGEGYADDGREEWAEERGHSSGNESEDELPLKGKAGESTREEATTIFLTLAKALIAKRKREEDKEKVEKTNNSINKYFNKGPTAIKPKASKQAVHNTPSR